MVGAALGQGAGQPAPADRGQRRVAGDVGLEFGRGEGDQAQLRRPRPRRRRGRRAGPAGRWPVVAVGVEDVGGDRVASTGPAAAVAGSARCGLGPGRGGDCRLATAARNGSGAAGGRPRSAPVGALGPTSRADRCPSDSADVAGVGLHATSARSAAGGRGRPARSASGRRTRPCRMRRTARSAASSPSQTAAVVVSAAVERAARDRRPGSRGSRADVPATSTVRRSHGAPTISPRRAVTRSTVANLPAAARGPGRRRSAIRKIGGDDHSSPTVAGRRPAESLLVRGRPRAARTAPAGVVHAPGRPVAARVPGAAGRTATCSRPAGRRSWSPRSPCSRCAGTASTRRSCSPTSWCRWWRSGVGIDIVAGVGPVVAKPIRTLADLDALAPAGAGRRRATSTEAVRQLVAELGADAADRLRRRAVHAGQLPDRGRPVARPRPDQGADARRTRSSGTRCSAGWP